MRTKWEYKTVTLSTGIDTEILSREYGVDGWEVVYVTTNAPDHFRIFMSYTVLMKRPLEDTLEK